jgi:hypothetical protein
VSTSLRMPSMTNLTIKVLRALRGSACAPLTVTQLRAQTGGRDQTIRLLLGRLIAAEWVVREPAPRHEAVTDPRFVFRLSERGAAEAAKALGPSDAEATGQPGEGL